MRIRKKPIEVEGWPITEESIQDLCRLSRSISPRKSVVDGRVTGLYILTLEGPMEAPLGAWLVKGVKGEFYFVQEAIFRESYDVVDELGEG